MARQDPEENKQLQFLPEDNSKKPILVSKPKEQNVIPECFYPGSLKTTVELLSLIPAYDMPEDE